MMAPAGRRYRILICSALVPGIVLGAWAAWRHLSWDNFGVVEEARVYRSGQLRIPQLRDAIDRYGLRTVLNLSHNPESPSDVEEEKLVRGRGLRYVAARWPGDGVVPPERLRWVAEVLSEPASQPVLVHCARGTYRTGAAVASLRILAQGWSPERAREEMERYGFDPAKQPGLADLIDGLGNSPSTRPAR